VLPVLSTPPALGALVRLAAENGGDDWLAAVALAHQLECGTRCLVRSLRDLADESTRLPCRRCESRNPKHNRRRRRLAPSPAPLQRSMRHTSYHTDESYGRYTSGLRRRT
jgi:hypothetical protein